MYMCEIVVGILDQQRVLLYSLYRYFTPVDRVRT
jgi:hypothetical protein